MCDLARSGNIDKIDIKPRKVTINKLDILSINKNKISFYVECSKGTYVRSICYDIGKVLGVGGCMSSLIRVKSGKFNLDNSITLDDLKEFKENDTLKDYLYDIDFVLSDFNKVILNDNAVKYYSNGGIIEENRFIEKDFTEKDGIVRVYSKDNFLGTGKIIRKDDTISIKSDKLFIV